MEKSKKIILLMMIVIIIIILLIGTILMFTRKKEINDEHPLSVSNTEIEKLENKDLFFNIDYYIRKYFGYVNAQNEEAINQIVTSKIEQPIDTIVTFKSEEMYVVDKTSNLSVYVYGMLRRGNIETPTYLIINIDDTNKAFSITNSSNTEYTDAKNGIVNPIYEQNISINRNVYNEFQFGAVTDLGILNIYFEDYKFKALYQTEEAFKLLDTEYRNKKFQNDIEQYKTYLQNNKQQLQDANIVKHGITKNGQFGEYIAIDSFNHYYKIIETGINQYTIILDNYTLVNNELVSKYNQMSANDKVTSNIDKIMKLINEKDYATVYKYLNTNFKNNYFPTLVSFENYIKQHFFDNNIVGGLRIQVQGENYIVTVPYKESLSQAAEEGKSTIIMKLTEGINFEIAFEMN
ncbi:MAG: hypothetical protein HFJ27_00125 [Clostridia bacterium]|nr:hypothetical protein [Clostridia bacterium]